MSPSNTPEAQRAYYAANREKYAALGKAYREANPEKDAARKKAWRGANLEKEVARGKACYAANPKKFAAKNKAYRADLGDGYVRGMLTQRSRLAPKDIPQGLVEVKRLQLLIKREVRDAA